MQELGVKFIPFEQDQLQNQNLFQLINQGYFDAAFLLLSEGQIQYTDLLEEDTKNSLLHLAVLQSKITEIIMIINKYPEHINFRNRSNQTPLMFACYMGNIAIIKFLINKGSDINATDNFNFSSLLYAIKSDLDFAAIYLISRGADIEIKDLNGCTVVHWAAFRNNINMLKLFVQHCKMPITQKDWENCTPFMRGSLSNQHEAVQFFLVYLKDQRALSHQIIQDDISLDRITSPFIKKKIREFILERSNTFYIKLIKSSSLMIVLFIIMVVIYWYVLSSFLGNISQSKQSKETVQYIHSFLEINTLIFVMLTIYFYLLCDVDKQKDVISKQTSVPYKQGNNSSFSVYIDGQQSPLILEENTSSELYEKDSYFLLDKALSGYKLGKATFLHNIVNLINDDRFIEISKIRSGYLDYNTLQVVQPRTNFCQEFNKSYSLFCFYSKFFDKPICLGSKHKIYMFIQTYAIFLITLYIFIINLSLWDFFQEYRVFMMLETPYLMMARLQLSLLHPISFFVIVYLYIVIISQWLTNIYGILKNLTYYEIMNDTLCYYFYYDIKPVKGKGRNDGYHYRIYKNINDKGYLSNIKFYFNV